MIADRSSDLAAAAGRDKPCPYKFIGALSFVKHSE
jgi:hypothetical protein